MYYVNGYVFKDGEKSLFQKDLLTVENIEEMETLFEQCGFEYYLVTLKEIKE